MPLFLCLSPEAFPVIKKYSYSQLIKNPGHIQLKNIVCFDVPRCLILTLIEYRPDYTGQGEWSENHRFF
jgi:hypothetical protein